jgi:hypothetical protein
MLQWQPKLRTMLLRPHLCTFLLAALALPCAAQPAAQPATDTARAESLPASGMLGFETVHLPGGESMGLVGGSLLFDVGDNWGVGPAVYGAATGGRGGLFVGGLEVQRRWALGRSTTLAAGLYAGGGGGAAAPVGSGLMLRPALTVLQDVGRSLQLGLSWSHVRFPSGSIGSTQLGLVLAWRNEFRHFTGGRPGDPVSAGEASGLGFDRMSVTVGQYDLADGGGRRIRLAGARAERRTGIAGLDWGLEAAAAASGDAAGYMEILGGAGVSIAPLPAALPSWRVGLRAAAGLGGGGAVPTGGGVLAKATATMSISPAPGWTVGAELGTVRGLNGDLRARHAQAWLGIDVEPGFDGRGTAPARLTRTEWSAAIQHHSRVARKDGTTRPLDTIGLKLARYAGESVYLTGQAHSAFAGGAGAYSIGLVGAGVAGSIGGAVRVGAELLAGAAGGGGVASGGGAIVQAVAWAGLNAGTIGEWRVGLGKARAARNGFDSPVIEVSWTRAFGAAGPGR